MSRGSGNNLAAGKLPWFKFFPTDWRADTGLKLCSLAARGLWIEMLAIMHEAGGYLEINGQAVNERALAALAGSLPEEVSESLAELEQAGVFSRNRRGRIYSRRMLRDLKKAGLAKSNGRKGGNPALKAPAKAPVPEPGISSCDHEDTYLPVKEPDNQEDKAQDKIPVQAGLKTQKPEARVQKDKTPPAGGIKTDDEDLSELEGAAAFRWSGQKREEVGGEESSLCVHERSSGQIWPEVAEMTELLRASSLPPMRPKTPARPETASSTASKAGRRGRRLDQDWEATDADRIFARERGMDHEFFATEALRFRNYWTSLAGRRACKLDWHRTWQNWVLRALEPGGGTGWRAGADSRGGSRPASLHPHRGEPGRSTLGQGRGTAGAGDPGRGAGGRQRPGGFELADVAARLLDRAAAQDDLSERGRHAGPAGECDPAN